MQTSKIVTGDTYAIKRHGVLTRFRVVEITTHKRSEGTTSEIVGYCYGDNAVQGDKLTLTPSDLMGPFQHFKELADKKAAEDAERKRIADEKEERAKKLRRALYRFVGAPVPAEKDYNQLFRATYSTGIEISTEGTKALLEAFEAKRPHLVEDNSTA